MDVLTYRGRLIELTVLFATGTDEWRLECWDLTPVTGGHLFDVRRNADGVLEVRPAGAPLPADLLERVLAIAADEIPEESPLDPAEGRELARAATTLEELVAVVGHENRHARAEAIPRLRARFPAEEAAFVALTRATRDPDEYVRSVAYGAVADMETGDVAGVLARGLRDPARDVRHAAILGLAALGDPRAHAVPDEWAGPGPGDCGVPEDAATEPVRLPGAYATFSPSHGAGLWATSAALTALAGLVRTATATTVVLDPPPDDIVEDGPVSAIAIGDSPDTNVTFRPQGTVLGIAGGATARDVLAETLESLAGCGDRLGDPVAPHLDLEYVPGSEWMEPESMWVTVILVP